MASTTTLSNPFAEDGDRVAPPAVFVVFGASGDLTSRTLAHPGLNRPLSSPAFVRIVSEKLRPRPGQRGGPR